MVRNLDDVQVPAHGLWWQSVTGMMEPGESCEETAHRELKEETPQRKVDPLSLKYSLVDSSIIHFRIPSRASTRKLLPHGSARRRHRQPRA